MYIIRVYVLEGCSYCQQAIQHIQSYKIPVEIILATNDPIIKAGNQSMNNGQDSYPILLYNTTKEMVVGYKAEEYDRICKAASVLFSAGTWNISRSPEQPDGENPAPPAEAAAGTN